MAPWIWCKYSIKFKMTVMCISHLAIDSTHHFKLQDIIAPPVTVPLQKSSHLLESPFCHSSRI